MLRDSVYGRGGVVYAYITPLARRMSIKHGVSREAVNFLVRNLTHGGRPIIVTKYTVPDFFSRIVPHGGCEYSIDW